MNCLTYWTSITALCLAASAIALGTDRPNVIIIMTDDMGYGGPSCYGSTIYKTPGIDRLAAEGMRFTDFHSSGVVCSPTRAGLMTGRYQQRVGVEAVIHPDPRHPENKKGIQGSERTFAELFQKAGYRTGLVGKWHLGYADADPAYHPMNHGFDSFRGCFGGNVDYISHWGDHLDHDWYHDRKEVHEEGYATHLFNKYALEFIEENKDHPFCLYVAHEAPHAPIQGPGDPITRGPDLGKRNANFPKSKSPDDAHQYMMSIMDEGVGQIRDKVEELGLSKKTLIVFLSDNGAAPKTRTNSPLLKGNKGSVYEGGHRVPGIFWMPGKIEEGTTNKTTAISLDVMPTILNVAGVKLPKGHQLDGVDLSQLIFSQQKLEKRQLYWWSLSNVGKRSEAMRDGDWKLVVSHPNAPPGTFERPKLELYNLKDDLAEKKDLAKEFPERVKAMHQQQQDKYAEIAEMATPQKGGWHLTPNWTNKDFEEFRQKKANEWGVEPIEQVETEKRKTPNKQKKKNKKKKK